MSKENKPQISISEKIDTFTEQTIRSLFSSNPDVTLQTFSFEDNVVTFVTCEGMVDENVINNVVYERIVYFFKNRQHKKITLDEINHSLYLPGIARVKKKEKLIADVFTGKLMIFFHNEQFLFSVDVSKRPQRKPEETSTEVSIKGPRDDFIEDIVTNIALIRKRLRTNSLAIKKYELGSRTQTQVAVLYIDDIVNQDILTTIDKKIQRIDIDGIYSGTQLKELLSDRILTFYPLFHYSGRPDFAVHSLLTGRIIILVDGVQYAIIAPVNLSFLLKSAEDSENIYLFNSFERLIRIVGIIIAIFLPGFWVALSSFHQDQIPISFLGTIIESRKGVPIPAPLEAILMVLLFEFFREAGVRLPVAIGSTLSVVGGLIIGDAAIRAGIASPLMIVLIATSAVATYTLVSLSLHGIVSILRFFVIICASFLGLFGFFISLFLIVFYAANIQTFGVPYLTVPNQFNLQQFNEMMKTFFRLPVSKYSKRPRMLNTMDDTAKPDEE
ncbi:spore germination protein [Pseudogracilibacillus sp. SO30301A]|uniref:spore germination protein n=1 Tax=Pseudogracilibacillus sp. SO30301A TaxID=3098291 RepID=UPI00300E221B